MPKNKAEIVLQNGSRVVSLDTIKRSYIVDGMSSEEIASYLNVTKEEIDQVIKDLKLKSVRSNLIKSGIKKIENKQLDQAKDIMNLDLKFKKLRLIQLEKQLEDFAAYYETHGDFYKRHPTTNKILKDSNGMPVQISVPNVSREILQIKDSLNLSQGLKNLLQHVDDIINSKNETPLEGEEGSTIIDVDALFKKR